MCDRLAAASLRELVFPEVAGPKKSRDPEESCGAMASVRPAPDLGFGVLGLQKL